VTACRRELKRYQCDIHPHEQASPSSNSKCENTRGEQAFLAVA
jgi:hypothetical protein